MLPKIFNPPRFLAASDSNPDATAGLDVVTTAAMVSSLSAKMNKKIENLVTIIWERRDGDMWNRPNLDRDDLYGICGEMRPACRLFKYYSNDLCSACDKYHYELLKSRVTGADFSEPIPESFSQSYTVPEPKAYGNPAVSYIEYHCPMMGYVELLFPIVIEGSFLGAALVGQILPDKDSKAKKYLMNS